MESSRKRRKPVRDGCGNDLKCLTLASRRKCTMVSILLNDARLNPKLHGILPSLFRTFSHNINKEFSRGFLTSNPDRLPSLHSLSICLEKFFRRSCHNSELTTKHSHTIYANTSSVRTTRWPCRVSRLIPARKRTKRRSASTTTLKISRNFAQQDYLASYAAWSVSYF